MPHLKPERVKHALHRIHEWALSARVQATVHLWPLLALLEKEAGIKPEVEFEESDDRDFWDRYFLLEKGDSRPYFNAITFRRAEANYPHSNAATIRKGTFRREWQAGTTTESADGKTLWSLSEAYALIFREKVLTKAGNVTRVPLLDVGILLFRNEEFPEGATTESVIHRFRERFKQKDEDFNEIFSIQAETPESLFTSEEVDIPAAYDTLILLTLVPEKIQAPKTTGVAAPTPLDDGDDPILTQVQQLLELGTSGIIFRGPPGTGKTWYAQKIAASLVANPATDIYRVQFHPSYGYEDFVEGFKPDDATKSGFNVVQKKFLEACHHASKINTYVVFIIDEINRGDPARIFGELLTFIERDYRGQEFLLPFSGGKASVPERLLLFGTMNPFDRSVAQVDAAFVRRFDHIEIPPSAEVVQKMLEDGGGFTHEQIALIVKWFESAQEMLDVGLGHAFFKSAGDLDKLQLIWKYRIWPTARVIIEQFSPIPSEDFLRSFNALIARLEGAQPKE